MTNKVPSYIDLYLGFQYNTTPYFPGNPKYFSVNLSSTNKEVYTGSRH